MTTHPEDRFSIAVTLGNHDTGRPDRNPLTRYPRGVRVQTRIDENRNQQLPLWGVPVIQTVKALVPPDTLWLLLHYRDMRKKEMRFELSLPIAVDAEGRASGWLKRIFFAPISFDDLGVDNGNGTPDDSNWDGRFDGDDDFPAITHKS